MTNQKKSELFKDQRWIEKAKSILERDGGKCQVCENKRDDVRVECFCWHDELPPWEYKDFYLVTICPDCWKLKLFIERVERMGGHDIYELSQIVNFLIKLEMADVDRFYERERWKNTKN